MRHITPLIALLATTGCVMVSPLSEPDEQPFREDPRACDVDRDGVRSIACGGLDCDDLDATVHPGADEYFGDDIDQDCDGWSNANLQVFDAPVRTEPLTWRWDQDLRALGGVIALPTGQLVAQDLELDTAFGGGVVRKFRSDYGPATDDMAAVRLSGPIDLVRRGGQLELWRPDGTWGQKIWSDIAQPGASLDAWRNAEQAWFVSCDGVQVQAVLVDLPTGTTLDRYAMDHGATACAVLGSSDAGPIVLTAGADVSLERWVLDAQSGFTKRLRLGGTVDPASLRTAANGQNAVLAFLDDGDLFVFDRDGEGTLVGAGAATDTFDVAVSPEGDVLVAWVDQDGSPWAAAGSLSDRLEVAPLAGFTAPDAVSAVVLDGELAVALQQGPELLLLRARR